MMPFFDSGNNAMCQVPGARTPVTGKDTTQGLPAFVEVFRLPATAEVMRTTAFYICDCR